MKTLDYAFRAKNIKNKPEANKVVSKQCSIMGITDELEHLKRHVESQRAKIGIHLSQEKYKQFMGLYNLRKHEKEEQEREQQVLRQRLLYLTEKVNRKMAENERMAELVKNNIQIGKNTEKDLEQCIQDKENTSIAVEHVSSQFKVLQKEAHTIAKIANETNKKEQIWIEKVNRLYDKNNVQSKALLEALDTMNNNLSAFESENNKLKNISDAKAYIAKQEKSCLFLKRMKEDVTKEAEDGFKLVSGKMTALVTETSSLKKDELSALQQSMLVSMETTVRAMQNSITNIVPLLNNSSNSSNYNNVLKFVSIYF